MEIPTPPAPTSKRPESFEDAEARRCAYQNVSQVEMEAKMARKGHAETKPCDTSAISEGGDLEKKQGTTAIPKSRTLPKTIAPEPSSAKLPEDTAEADGEQKVLRWEMWRVITKSFRP